MSKTSQPKRETERSVEHDHSACVQTALSRAGEGCAEEGERFTGLGRQVLELVWAEHKPAKAYDLLKKLSDIRSGVAPTTVYRTLDFLQERGLVCKIESLNAYVDAVTKRRTQRWSPFILRLSKSKKANREF